jgi:hypothetical protein
MVSAARAQYLKPMRGFQSNCFALSVNSLALMGPRPMFKSVLLMMALATSNTCRRCEETALYGDRRGYRKLTSMVRVIIAGFEQNRTWVPDAASTSHASKLEKVGDSEHAVLLRAAWPPRVQ